MKEEVIIEVLCDLKESIRRNSAVVCGEIDKITGQGEKDGISLIAEERARQIEVEGYSWRHDDQETTHQLSDAAIVYACAAPMRYEIMHKWPWDEKYFKPDETYTIDGRIRELTKAGALICAEIDRLIRLKNNIHPNRHGELRL